MSAPRVPFAVAISLSLAASAAPSWPDLSQVPPAGGGENDAALIVSIERYAEVPGIPGAGDNARDWYAYLTASRRVPTQAVSLLRDREGTAEKIRRYAQEAAGAAKPGGTLWVVFIGHGAPAPDGKDGVLVGYDAQQDADSLYARSVRQSELLQLVSGGRQARTVVVLDACFSGRTALGTSLIPGLQPLLVVKAAAPLAATAVLTAARSDQFAGPLPGANRPAFSYLVLGALRGWGDKDGDGKVTAREAVDYATDALRLLVKDRAQTPELLGDSQPLSQGSEKGPDLAQMVAARREARPEGELRFGTAVEIRIPRVQVESRGTQNLQAEKLLEGALDAEESPAATAEEKASAWCGLAAMEEDNPYLAKARSGCTAWRRYASTVRHQRLGLAEDYHTIAGYLSLKRVSLEDKLSAARAFLGTYGALSADERVHAVEGAASALGGGIAPALPTKTDALQGGCQSGTAQDCTVLGRMNAKGVWPLSRDEGAALKLFTRGCELGSAEGCSDLASVYERGRAVGEDLHRAAELYDQGCRSGDGRGCFALAKMLDEGRGQAADPARAEARYLRACELGDSQGCLAVGKRSLTAGKSFDPARGVEAYEAACDLGAPEGCTEAAGRYREGNGVPRDVRKAAALYERRCNQDHAPSCAGQAELTQGDAAEALFTKACALGASRGCDWLKERKQQRALAERQRQLAEQQRLQAARDLELSIQQEHLNVRYRRYAGYGAAGLGAAALVGSGVFALMGAHQNDVIVKGPFPDAAAVQQAVETGRAYNTGSIACLVGGAVALAASVPLVLMNPQSAEGLTAQVAPAGAGIFVWGSF